MTHPHPETPPEPLNLLADWIGRDQLARELGLTADTLARWEARRQGPPCTRIGRRTTLPAGRGERLDPCAGTGAPGAQIAGSVMTLPARIPAPWPADRLGEARAVIADVAHHSDHLIRLACDVLVQHGDTAAEREDAQRLLVVIDARRPVRRAQRDQNGRAAE